MKNVDCERENNVKSKGKGGTACLDRLEVGVLLVGEGGGLGGLELGLVLGHQVGVNLHLGRGKGGRGDELEGGVADELAGEPEEGALEVELGAERGVVGRR